MPNKPKSNKKPWQRKRVPFGRRRVNNANFYNSHRWRKVAKRHKELNPYCTKCLEENKHIAVQFTDHVVRIEDGGAPYADENLQSLCERHHNQKSGREAHGYKEGMGLKHKEN